VRTSARFARECKAFGKRVRDLRIRRGWTLERAAEEMDVDLVYLQKVEAGRINVTLATLLRISDGFDLPIGDLFRED